MGEIRSLPIARIVTFSVGRTRRNPATGMVRKPVQPASAAVYGYAGAGIAPLCVRLRGRPPHPAGGLGYTLAFIEASVFRLYQYIFPAIFARAPTEFSYGVVSASVSWLGQSVRPQGPGNQLSGVCASTRLHTSLHLVG